MKRMVRLFQVYHPEGSDVGLRPPKSTSRRLAEAAARKWNRDCPGHVVQEVTQNDKVEFSERSEASER